MQGRDFSAIVRVSSHDSALRPRSLYLQEATAGDQAVAQGMVPWRGVRTARWTYARNLDGPWVLFDNQADPYQLRNLADDPGSKALRDEFDGEMRAWMEEIGDALEPVDAFMAREGLAAAWAEREAFLHRDGNMSGSPPLSS
jgi:arylsulfatase A-like enzyme